MVTNDDGIGAAGLSILAGWCRSEGHQTLVVAPKSNCSGQSGAVTFGKPLSVKQLSDDHWAVGGTPADCVRIAVSFLNFQPDVVLSGINHGHNLGCDTFASGTVGAARMAAIRGIPAVAFSAPDYRWTEVQQLLRRHGSVAIDEALQFGTEAIISVNFPVFGGESMMTARLSRAHFDDALSWEEFQGDEHIVRLASAPTGYEGDADSDIALLSAGWTVLTHVPVIPRIAAPDYTAGSKRQSVG
nr:5'/3'-nucleotidase SurE [Sulfobacillus harzensis]